MLLIFYYILQSYYKFSSPVLASLFTFQSIFWLLSCCFTQPPLFLFPFFAYPSVVCYFMQFLFFFLCSSPSTSYFPFINFWPLISPQTFYYFQHIPTTIFPMLIYIIVKQFSLKQLIYFLSSLYFIVRYLSFFNLCIIENCVVWFLQLPPPSSGSFSLVGVNQDQFQGNYVIAYQYPLSSNNIIPGIDSVHVS